MSQSPVILTWLLTSPERFITDNELLLKSKSCSLSVAYACNGPHDWTQDHMLDAPLNIPEAHWLW
jgi:hypothetical protein